MKKFLKAMVFGCLMLSSLVGCDKEETNNQTNNNNTNNTTENNNNNNNTVVDPKLTGITVNANNVKKTYTYGEALDLTGLVVTANYDNNTNKAVTDYTTNPANGSSLNTIGEVSITVTYQEKTDSFKVTVEKSLTGISLNTASVKTSYNHNEALNLTGLVVNAVYNDGSTEAVTDYTTNPANGTALNTVGNQTVTVTYKGKTSSFDVAVNRTLSSIGLNISKVKKEYKHNETFTSAGLVVTAVYSDGFRENVDNYTTDPAEGATLDQIGTKTVTVAYEGKTTTYDINVVVALVNISIDSTNVKKDYKQDDKLDLTGLVVTANYSDGTATNVTDYTVNPVNGTTLSTIGTQTITVTYEGKTASFGVEVEKKLVSITLDTSNVKKEYYQGDSVDLTGLVVTANYSDGSTANVSALATNNVPDGYTFVVFNTLTVTISYNGKTASFNCTCSPFKEKGHTATIDLDREFSIGPNNGWGPNTTMLTGYGTKGSNYRPCFKLVKRSTAEGSMTFVNGKTRFLAGDSIENDDRIGGITKITVNGGSGNFTLSVGYSKDSMHTFLDSESSGGDRIFDNIPHVNYFLLTGKYDNYPADISSIEIEYTRNENFEQVAGTPKTIDDVTVYEGTFTKEDKTIVVSGNTLTLNGNEYTFVGIEYKGSLLYRDHSTNGLLVKYNNENQIEVANVKDHFDSISGAYNKVIPATSITLSMDSNTVAENSPSSRFNMTTRDFFTFSASCNASPAETPSIKLVDETNGDADPIVGTYTLRNTIYVIDAFYTVEEFELSVNPIVVTKVGDTYKVSYVDVGNDDYTSHSGNYDAEFKNNKLIISADDGFGVTIDLDARKVEFQYYNEDDYVFLMGDMAYDFVSSSKPTARLDNGLVRAVSAGDFYLEALTSNGITARYYVHVSEYVPAMLTVDTTPLTLNIGDTHNINPSISANATKPGVTYESSNGNVAYVSADGVITARAAGTATIYVVTMDDTKSIEVTVNGVSQPAGVTYTFDDDNGDSHTVSVIENDSLNIDGTYQFVYLNTESAYVYENDASVKVTIRDAGGAIYLEIVDDNQVIFGFQEDCGVCSYNTDQFELTEVEEQNNSSSGNTTNNSSTTNTNTNNGGTSNASTNTGAEISQESPFFTSLPTYRTTLYFLNYFGVRTALDYLPNQAIVFQSGLTYDYNGFSNTYCKEIGELTFEIKNNKLVLKSNLPFNVLPGFREVGGLESVTEIELLKK